MHPPRFRSSFAALLVLIAAPFAAHANVIGIVTALDLERLATPQPAAGSLINIGNGVPDHAFVPFVGPPSLGSGTPTVTDGGATVTFLDPVSSFGGGIANGEISADFFLLGTDPNPDVLGPSRFRITGLPALPNPTYRYRLYARGSDVGGRGGLISLGANPAVAFGSGGLPGPNTTLGDLTSVFTFNSTGAGDAFDFTWSRLNLGQTRSNLSALVIAIVPEPAPAALASLALAALALRRRR